MAGGNRREAPAGPVRDTLSREVLQQVKSVGSVWGCFPNTLREGGLCRERGLWRPQQDPAVGNRAFGRHATESACSARGQGRPRPGPAQPVGAEPRAQPPGPALPRGRGQLSRLPGFPQRRGAGAPLAQGPFASRPRSRRGRHSPACPRCAARPFPPIATPSRQKRLGDSVSSRVASAERPRGRDRITWRRTRVSDPGRRCSQGPGWRFPGRGPRPVPRPGPEAERKSLDAALWPWGPTPAPPLRPAGRIQGPL